MPGFSCKMDEPDNPSPLSLTATQRELMMESPSSSSGMPPAGPPACKTPDHHVPRHTHTLWVQTSQTQVHTQHRDPQMQIALHALRCLHTQTQDSRPFSASLCPSLFSKVPWFSVCVCGKERGYEQMNGVKMNEMNE